MDVRVALLNPRSQRRGGEIFSRQLAEELGRRGHELLEIYLYLPSGDQGLPPAPAEIHLGRGHGRWPERLLGWDPGIIWRLRRALADFRPDVLQVSGGKTIRYAALALALDRSGARPLFVYSSIGQPGVWVRGAPRRWLYSRWIFPSVTAVVTVARRFVPELERLCPNARVVRWIPRGVDRRRLEPTASREAVRDELDTALDSAVALYAGALAPEKRVDRLLRAFAAGLRRLPTATLWIAGGGDLDATLRGLADELGIGDNVRFLGTRADIGNLLSASDLVALTSDTEGVPGILREAAAAGRAMVATRAGATDEVVLDGETGLLVECDDAPALTRALFDLLADPERHRRMGDQAARHSRQSSLSIEAAAEAHEAFYREALGRRVREASA